ncbi:polysaccharide biosynthesis tyrosine autokinase [Dermacoccaceae bacterium W4C1]
MTLEDVWKLTRRYWVLLMLGMLLGTALAGVYVLTRTPVYTATTQAYVAPVSSGSDQDNSTGSAYSGTLLAQQKAKAWVPLITSTGTAQTVIKNLGLSESPQSLAAGITAELAEDTSSITVSATADTPVKAQRIANEIVTATASEARRLEGNSSGVEVKAIQNAQLPDKPSSPRPERILPIGAFAGLVIGYLIALVRLRQDTRVRTPDDVERNVGASVLAVMPTTKDLSSKNRTARGGQNFAAREALRQLRTNLRFVDIDHTPRTIVVTSARMGEGKSTVAANLARVLAESGQPVVLVDADLRRPTVSNIFDVDGSVGLTQVLAGTVSVTEALQETAKNLRVLSAGQIPPNPSELLGSERMHQLLLALRENYMVILDAPPLLPVTDAALLTARADGALLVIASTDTREEHLKRAVNNLERVGGRILGAVLNRVNTSKLNRIVYGEDQYGHGAYGGYGEYVQSEQVSTDLTDRRSAKTRGATSAETEERTRTRRRVRR